MLTIPERAAVVGLGALALGVWGLQLASRIATRLLTPHAEDLEDLELSCSEPRGLRPRPRHRSLCDEAETWR